METQSYYLSANNKLSKNSPDQNSVSNYKYDPSNPITITEGTNVWQRSAEMRDRSILLERDDVITFETEELNTDTEITLFLYQC